MVNKDVEKIVELYFQGYALHEAISTIRAELKVRGREKMSCSEIPDNSKGR